MKEDFNKLRLKYHGDNAKLHEILQLECRKKTASKLHDILKCHEFTFPSLAVAEMSTSDDIAAIHTSFINEGDEVLDMTCGLGIDAFHFAQKARHVTTIELDHDCYSAAIHNANALGLENVTVIEADSIRWLQACDRHFDSIFIDPARRDNSGRHFALADCRPDIIPALPLLLSRCHQLIIKASPMLDIKKAVEELKCKCHVVAIGTAKECKELVFILTGSMSTAAPYSPEKISCITSGHQAFAFTPEENQQALPAYSLPEAGSYLFEPFPSVMKGGGMKLLSQRFNVAKLHPNTNLFTATRDCKQFPGESFEIIDILPFNKQTVKRFAASYPLINVAVRNLPISAPQLAAKLKVKEGGDKMVFGVTGLNDQILLIVTTMGKAKALIKE